MHLIYSSFIILMFFLVKNISTQGRTCHLKELDLCITTFAIDQKGIPVNDKQFRKSCNSWRILNNCISAYVTRCAKHPLRETVEVITAAFNGPFEELCSKPVGDPARLELYKNGKCLNANQNKIGVCREQSKNAIFFMMDSYYDKQFPALCCNLRNSYECSYNKTVEACGKETAEFTNNYYSITKEIVDICNHFTPGSPECEGMIVPDDYKTSLDPKSPVYRTINAAF